MTGLWTEKPRCPERSHSRTARFVQADRWPAKIQVTAQYHRDVREGTLKQTNLKMDGPQRQKHHARFHSVAQSEWEEATVGMSSLLHSRKRRLVQRDQGLCCNTVTAGWQFSINCMNPWVRFLCRLRAAGSVFSWCTSIPLLQPTEHHSRDTAYLNISDKIHHVASLPLFRWILLALQWVISS